MSLSSDLISQFVKITRDEPETKKESVVSGTVQVLSDGSYGVKLDGSLPDSEPIPISAEDNTTTTELAEGNRVLVTIRNHSAIITGNLSSPSVGTGTVVNIRDTANSANITATGAAQSVSNMQDQINEFGTVFATKVETSEIRTGLASVTERLDAKDIQVQTLTTKDAEISGKLSAAEGEIVELKSKDAEISGKISASEGEISKLKTDKLDATVANSTYATIENLTSTNTEVNTIKGKQATFEQTATGKFSAIEADIKDINTKKLSATDIEGKYANIDFSNIGEAAVEKFYAVSGLIKNVTLESGTVVKELIGVLIKGDLIEGGTIAADKLIVKGEDGLYYKLNVNALGEAVASSDAKYQNGLDGSVIIAKSIAAEKISVSDLKAFGATIGGFKIGDSAIHSVAKTSASNTTRGIYMDNLGQFVVGDASNYIKYFKDTDGQYKLDISMMSNMKIGGRNLLPDTDFGDSSKRHERLTGTSTEGGFHFYPTEQIISGIEYVISCSMRGNANVNFYQINSVGGNVSKLWITRDSLSETEYRDIELVFSVETNRVFQNVYICTCWGEENTSVGDWFEIKPRSLKLERGNRKTDWTPAPEDMATAEEAEKAQTTANTAQEAASEATSLIKQLADSISMLVTDGNGTSLMTQTEDGWTFSTAEINNSVNDISNALATLTESASNTEHAVSILQEAVSDLGEIAEYVAITTYEDEPCIELGEGDSDFKLRITNTRMLFTEGSTVLAYFTNQSFHSKRVVIEEELQQGGFVWKKRSNGNLGLIWKGVSS